MDKGECGNGFFGDEKIIFIESHLHLRHIKFRIQVDFRIRCGKGTYIRSLARDFGEALGSGAFLSSLRRTQIGEYRVDQAMPLSQVQNFFLG